MIMAEADDKTLNDVATAHDANPSRCHPFTPSPPHPLTPSPPRKRAPSRRRAWLYLIRLSWQRQARAHLMVWIALGLLVFTVFIVFLNTQFGRWNTSYWRFPRRGGLTQAELLERVESVGY